MSIILKRVGTAILRLALCDDENNYINIIENYLEALSDKYPKFEWDAFYSGEDLLSMYQTEKKPYDIVFLDMEMGVLNGIDTANNLRKYDEKVVIVYITNHSQYVYECFDAMPLRFLIKPVSFESFEKIFALAYNKITINNKPFFFNIGTNSYRIYCEDILYFESNKRKVILHMADNNYEFYGKLESIAKELYLYDFIPTHKSFLVNMNHIYKFDYTTLTMTNGSVIPVSDNNRKNVKAAHRKFLGRDYK